MRAGRAMRSPPRSGFVVDRGRGVTPGETVTQTTPLRPHSAARLRVPRSSPERWRRAQPISWPHGQHLGAASSTE